MMHRNAYNECDLMGPAGPGGNDLYDRLVYGYFGSIGGALVIHLPIPWNGWLFICCTMTFLDNSSLSSVLKSNSHNFMPVPVASNKLSSLLLLIGN